MDLVSHIKRQIAFSRATYGPGERRQGVINHIKEELKEIENETPEEAAREWVDVVILAFDGLTRALKEAGVEWDEIPQTAVDMFVQKQSINEQRDWPDWRQFKQDQHINHVRDS